MKRWGGLGVGVLLATAVLVAQVPKLETLGPKVGTRAQEFSGVDQFGKTHTLQSLLGRDGLMLVFYRSADW
jgi:hypothetical protein